MILISDDYETIQKYVIGILRQAPDPSQNVDALLEEGEVKLNKGINRRTSTTDYGHTLHSLYHRTLFRP
ncbi:7181_t:CDS:2, partial [Gigaspora rosea]